MQTRDIKEGLINKLHTLREKSYGQFIMLMKELDQGDQADLICKMANENRLILLVDNKNRLIETLTLLSHENKILFIKLLGDKQCRKIIPPDILLTLNKSIVDAFLHVYSEENMAEIISDDPLFKFAITLLHLQPKPFKIPKNVNTLVNYRPSVEIRKQRDNVVEAIFTALYEGCQLTAINKVFQQSGYSLNINLQQLFTETWLNRTPLTYHQFCRHRPIPTFEKYLIYFLHRGLNLRSGKKCLLGIQNDILNLRHLFAELPSITIESDDHFRDKYYAAIDEHNFIGFTVNTVYQLIEIILDDNGIIKPKFLNIFAQVAGIKREAMAQLIYENYSAERVNFIAKCIIESLLTALSSIYSKQFSPKDIEYIIALQDLTETLTFQKLKEFIDPLSSIRNMKLKLKEVETKYSQPAFNVYSMFIHSIDFPRWIKELDMQEKQSHLRFDSAQIQKINFRIHVNETLNKIIKGEIYAEPSGCDITRKTRANANSNTFFLIKQNEVKSTHSANILLPIKLKNIKELASIIIDEIVDKSPPSSLMDQARFISMNSIMRC